MRELFPVSRDGVQSGDDVLVPVRHFDGVGNRPDSLLFEAGCTAIPEDATPGIGQGSMSALINPGPPQEGPCAGLQRRATRPIPPRRYDGSPPCRLDQSCNQDPTLPAAACGALTPPIDPFGSAPCSSSNSANASWRFTIADGSTCVPSAPVSLTSTPAARSVSAIAMSPSAAASSSGVKPSAVNARGSAPRPSRMRTIS